MTATKIRSVIIPDTMSRKMNRASTLPAMLEARCGHNGKLSNISPFKSDCVTGFCVFPVSTRRNPLEIEERDQQASQNQNGEASAQIQNVTDDRAIFPGGGIVVIAIQKNLVDGISDPT